MQSNFFNKNNQCIYTIAMNTLHRTITILRYLNGQPPRTAKDIYHYLVKQEGGNNIGLRTLQTTLKELEQYDLIQRQGPSNHPLFTINTTQDIYPEILNGFDKLSLYIAKSLTSSTLPAHNQEQKTTANGKKKKKQPPTPTTVRDELDVILPGHAIAMENVFGHVNIKKYNPDILHSVLKFIGSQRWARVRSIRSEHTLKLYFMFEFRGEYYVATWNPLKNHAFSENDPAPYYKNYGGKPLCIALRNIVSIIELERSSKFGHLLPHQFVPTYSPTLPEFESKFHQTHFGVWRVQSQSSGRVPITLHINNDMADYFERRFWHPSQQMTRNDDGTLILKLHAPLALDLITWVWEWHPYVTILEPTELQEHIRQRAQQVQEMYP